MTPAAPERLNRFLARRGIASRRAADELIAAGRVTVNGEPGQVGAQVVPAHDRVRVDGVDVAAASAHTLMLNKPAGVITTRRDPGRRPTVMQLVRPIAGLVPVGRLDADTRGLLLLTTDGELAHRVTHPRYGVTKRYVARLDRRPTVAQMQRLTSGVLLEDGPARALGVEPGAAAASIELTMVEGRKREVRRLCAAVGLEVRDLVRVALGPLRLGDLREGAARGLTLGEDRALRAAVGLAAACGAGSRG